jgi:hypothetical protein
MNDKKLFLTSIQGFQSQIRSYFNEKNQLLINKRSNYIKSKIADNAIININNYW